MEGWGLFMKIPEVFIHIAYETQHFQSDETLFEGSCISRAPEFKNL